LINHTPDRRFTDFVAHQPLVGDPDAHRANKLASVVAPLGTSRHGLNLTGSKLASLSLHGFATRRQSTIAARLVLSGLAPASIA